MTETDMAKLSDREQVRLRSGMYIGDCGQNGLHHLIGELLKNSLREYLQGHATQLTLTIHRDGSLSVEDDGRGIAVGPHREESKQQQGEISILEVAMSRLPAGHHGLGLKMVNFLSQFCRATVWRDGYEHQLEFKQGELVSELQQIGATNQHGTRITFAPDQEIFENTEFDFVRLQTRVRELALLHPGLIIKIHDERTTEFQFARGISQMVDDLSLGRWGCSEVFRLETEGAGGQFDIAFQFAVESGPQIRLYVNGERVTSGGTPVDGLIAGIAQVFRGHVERQRRDALGEYVEDFAQRLTAVIALRHPSPYFAGPCRDRLVNPELANVVQSAVSRYLQQRFDADEELVAQQWHMAALIARHRTEEDEEHPMPG